MDIEQVEKANIPAKKVPFHLANPTLKSMAQPCNHGPLFMKENGNKEVAFHLPARILGRTKLHSLRKVFREWKHKPPAAGEQQERVEIQRELLASVALCNRIKNAD